MTLGVFFQKTPSICFPLSDSAIVNRHQPDFAQSRPTVDSHRVVPPGLTASSILIFVTSSDVRADLNEKLRLFHQPDFILQS